MGTVTVQVAAVRDACAAGLAPSRVYSFISPLWHMKSTRSVPIVFSCALCMISCFFLSATNPCPPLLTV